MQFQISSIVINESSFSRDSVKWLKEFCYPSQNRYCYKYNAVSHMHELDRWMDGFKCGPVQGGLLVSVLEHA